MDIFDNPWKTGWKVNIDWLDPDVQKIWTHGFHMGVSLSMLIAILSILIIILLMWG